ncbi:MAG: hypothetical protein AMXMBFR78_36460 [Rubrivivax sp.]
MKTSKAVPIILRRTAECTEILVFTHPQAGVQFVKGTVEQDESVIEAAARELTEESGVSGAVYVRDLGTWESCPRGQVWHFQEMHIAEELQDSWEHFTTDGGGHMFRFHWHPLDEQPTNTWHPVYLAALRFVRERLATSSIQHATGAPSGAA